MAYNLKTNSKRKYVPKGKVQILQTEGNEFIFIRNGMTYKGPYIETSDGKFYAGDDPYKRSRGNELSKRSTNVLKPRTKNERTFNINKPPHFKYLNKTKPILISKPRPTEEDYKKYKFTRYFAKKINSELGYLEIDKETYDSIQGKENVYDHILYHVGTIEWALRGDTFTINANTLIKEERYWNNLSMIFKNLKEYKSDEPIDTDSNIHPIEIQTDFLSTHLQEAILFSQKKPRDTSPKTLMSKTNHTLYDIPDRKYANGEPIPPNLPPNYGWPKPIEKVLVEKQHCHNCYFNQMGYCGYWGAEIKHEYWCYSWVDIEEEKITYKEFTEDIKERMSATTNTASTVGMGGEGEYEDRNKIRPTTRKIIGERGNIRGEAPEGMVGY
jgi:hypothetical protein